MPPRPHCILLVGAPGSDELRWEEDQLLRDFDKPFTRMLDGKHLEKLHATDSSDLIAPTGMPSKWRSITLESKDNDSRAQGKDAPLQTQFLSFLGDDKDGEDDNHMDFLEHSIAAFDDLASSQILQDGAQNNHFQDLNTSIDFSTSFATTSATESSFSTTTGFPGHHSPSKASLPVTLNGHVTNLKQIPSADYITSIAPQTVTVNLIVGLITVSPARTVRLKRSHAEMDIIEVVVGDDTRAGFTITFWLAPIESQNKPDDDLRVAVQGLRAGDVILLQNVALSCFRNCVYGQSLSKRFARNSTSITVLEEDSMPILPPHAHVKAQRVEEWIGDFVGKERKATALVPSERTGLGMADALPPDTQD